MDLPFKVSSFKICLIVIEHNLYKLSVRILNIISVYLKNANLNLPYCDKNALQYNKNLQRCNRNLQHFNKNLPYCDKNVLQWNKNL